MLNVMGGVMKKLFLSFVVCAAAFVADAAAQTTCPEGQKLVPKSNGEMVCVKRAKSFEECVATSNRNGWSDARSRSYCAQLWGR
jgi:hypothetical protein